MLTEETIKSSLVKDTYDENYDILTNLIYDYYSSNTLEVIMWLEENDKHLDISVVKDLDIDNVEDMALSILYHEFKHLLDVWDSE